jgi:hypothetical protein
MVEMPMSDIYRNYQTILACRRADRLTIEGVNFDLGHAELDRNVWEPASILGDHPYFDLHAPRLLFPWCSDEEQAIFENRGDGVEVQAGDTVLIDHVQSVEVRSERGKLDHPHHQERRWAYLVVLSPDGERRAVQPAWQFRGVADVMSPISRGDYKDAGRALQARLALALGLEDLDDIEDLLMAENEADWIHLVNGASDAHRAAAKALWAAEQDYAPDAGMAFGYLMGRMETERVIDLAVRRQSIADANRGRARRPRKGGNESRAVAIEIIRRSPKITRKQCAAMVANRRNLADAKSVERTISALFQKDKDGVLRAIPLEEHGY